MKILVSMSGGMKSLVTAWLLKKQGMQVRGVYFDLLGTDLSLENVHGLERKLGISIQVIPAKTEFSEFFMEAQKRALEVGELLHPKLFFQQSYLFPKLMELKQQHQFSKIATGHRVLIQEDQVAKVFRVFHNSDEELQEVLPFLGLTQNEIATMLLPLGSIPSSMFTKLSKELEVGSEKEPATWENDFKVPEGASERLFEVFNPVGVRVGSYKSDLLPYPGMKYTDEKNDGVYRVLDVSFQTNQITAKPIHELEVKEIYFQDVSWFSRRDLGLKSLGCGIISETRVKPLLVNLLQFEGNRIKAYLNQPLVAEEVNIFKGQTMLWVEGSEILGGGRVFGTR
jgi:tRNA U34 2-thiouridine synthase MnmA/TrmU